MPRRHTYFCAKAAELAEKSTMQQRHGCVIVYNDRDIIAKGFNHMRCTMETTFSVHAEIEAVNKLRQVLRTKNKDYINKCTLYVVRVSRNHELDNPLCMSLPCEKCREAIHAVGIKRICYSL